jgi:chromosome segregation ATPase
MTEQFEVPAIAKITPPQKPAPAPEPAAPSEEKAVMMRAAALVDDYEKQRQALQVMLTEATLAIEARNRTIKAYELELAEARNNLAAMQSQIEACRQEVSDCRAFFGSIRAQFDHFEIPLPIRRKVKNGKQLQA